MILGGEAPTPLDLNFRLFGFPVRVTPWFWLVTALFGSNLFNVPGIGPLIFLIWVLCVFVSILIHELGHAFAFRLFGSPAVVVLHGMGGVAIGHQMASPVKSIVVSLAGPFAQFVLAGVVFASAFAGWPATNEYTAITYRFLLWINVVWAIINLLPILPLDGGNVCREVLALCRFRNPDAGAAAVSIAVAGLLALTAIAAYLRIEIPGLKQLAEVYTPNMFQTFWLIILAVENYQRYQAAQRYSPRFYDQDDDTPPWRRR